MDDRRRRLPPTGRLIGTITANRTDLGARSVPLLRSGLASHGEYLRIAYDRPGGASRARVLPTSTGSAPGTVSNELNELNELDDGKVSAIVDMARPGIVALSASYDPGWRANVDGHAQPNELVPPALIATRVPAGIHTVNFRYTGYGGYPWLFALGAVALLAIGAGERLKAGKRARREAGQPASRSSPKHLPPSPPPLPSRGPARQREPCLHRVCGSLPRPTRHC